MKYRNTFEIFGDAGAYEAESAREFARAYLMFYPKEGDEYRVTGLRHSERVGNSNEIDWCDSLLADCHDVEEDIDPDEPLSGLISEDLLLDHLEEAVEEVQ